MAKSEVITVKEKPFTVDKRIIRPTRWVKAMQYTGTNAPELIAFCSDVKIMGANRAIYVFKDGYPLKVRALDYIVVENGLPHLYFHLSFIDRYNVLNG